MHGHAPHPPPTRPARRLHRPRQRPPGAARPPHPGLADADGGRRPHPWALAVLGVALGLFILWKWWERRRFLHSLVLARIAPPELEGLISGGKQPLVVDVRTATALQVDPRRIPGALRMTLDELDARLD